MSLRGEILLGAAAMLLCATAVSAETLKLEGSWKSSLGPWKGASRMTITELSGTRLAGTSQASDGLCVGEHPVEGQLRNGRWKLVTRPGGMCKEMRIELVRQGDTWSGTYELVGPAPDKGTNTLKVVK
ncbi:hypothetical protein MTX26_24180 [Bradyrhizobium sp. ISRA443]|uniref:hypothetical protein n=1 Tax=unclassified Bradyrhizobium TaxID=2631580 RepID=UPI00247A9110|nr:MULTISPECIES: hypothetical protein [unclassified Bradyrhizobium]WGR97495.1 hypothetical protein MTX23_24175 [Bradyrhizobium sp. ISRA436]WGS04385.1 hypothetical protein MTX18_24180 [Bradyrhizobium sp. ISRA437]WGS11267.1 hypothetical protein MTX26_24180 [Bradyrhizobium sp. ISRA443]